MSEPMTYEALVAARTDVDLAMERKRGVPQAREMARICGHVLDLLDEVSRMREDLLRAELELRNVLALSNKLQKKDPENAGHLQRFCARAGIVPSVMR